MAITYDPDNDFYLLLGVDDEDDFVKIKASYRRLARKLHQDVNPNPEDQEEFKAVSEAYACLSELGPRKEYDEAKAFYFFAQPPALRLSGTSVDFGRAQAADKVERSVLIYNDGGDGVCSMSAQSGRFWKLVVQAASDDDPGEAVGKLVFILDIDADEAAGSLEEEIKVFLENDTEVSAQKLYLRVEAYGAAKSDSEGAFRPWYAKAAGRTVTYAANPSTVTGYFDEPLDGADKALVVFGGAVFAAIGIVALIYLHGTIALVNGFMRASDAIAAWPLPVWIFVGAVIGGAIYGIMKSPLKIVAEAATKAGYVLGAMVLLTTRVYLKLGFWAVRHLMRQIMAHQPTNTGP